jgi:hypothetical protein
MGKWVYMIVIVFIGVVMYYYLFVAEKAQPGTPGATATAFMKAILKDDLARARSFCGQSALNDAERVIERVKAVNPDPLGITYKTMVAKPPYKGVLVSFQGNMVPMEMVKEGEGWKIANISIN